MSSSKNHVVLSVDFDFFVREKIEYDWGHKEAPFFINEVWPIRAMQDIGIIEETSVIGNPAALAQELENLKWKFKKNCKLSIAESHASAYGALRGKENLEIINIDAHHDIAYGQIDRLDCGNWIAMLAIDGTLKKVTVVYPEWRREEDFDRPSDETLRKIRGLGVEVDIVYGIGSTHPRKVDEVFIARSGAWVPPWNDEAFMDFVSSWIFRTNGCTLYTYDSIEKFRRNFPLEEIKKAAKETKKIWEELKQRNAAKIVA